jgi:hypothetical protein
VWHRHGPKIAALAALIPHLRVLSGHREFFHDDHSRFTVPLAKLVTEALGSGHLPLWNPWILTGTPLVGERGGMIAHPGLWLAFVLEPSHAVSVLIVLFLAVLAYGTTAFLLECGAATTFAVIAGVAASLMGPALSYTGNAPYLATLAFYPLALYAALGLARRGRGVLLGGFALGLAILGGDLPGAALLALVSFAMYWAAGGRAAGLVRLVRVLALALLIGAGAWYPVLWALPISERAAGIAAEEAGRWSFHPLEWLGLVWPHPLGLPLPEFSFWPFRWLKTERLFLHSVWIGALATVAAGWSFRRGDRLARLLTGTALALLVLAMGKYSPAWSAVRPLFTFLRYPSKLAAPAALFLFLAGALGLSRLLDNPKSLIRLAVIALLCGALGVLLGPLMVRTWASDVPEDVIAVACGDLRTGTARVVALSVLVILSAVLASRGRLPVRRLTWVVSLAILGDVGIGTLDLVWTRSPLPVSRPDYVPAADVRGPRVMRLAEVATARLARTTAAFSAEQAREAQLCTPLVNAPLHISVMEPYGLYPGELGLAMAAVNERDPVWTAELLGVDVLLTSPHAAAPWLRQAVDKQRLAPKHRLLAGAIAMEMPNRLPRSYLAGTAAVDSRTGVRNRLAAGEGRDTPLVVAREVLWRGRPAKTDDSWHLTGSASLRPLAPEAWRPGYARYRVQADGDALLVELDAFLPGWRAFVDGNEVPIREVNLMSRGVAVSKGEHQVEFRFGTAGLVASLWSSWIVLGGVCLTSIALGRRKGGRSFLARAMRASLVLALLLGTGARATAAPNDDEAPNRLWPRAGMLAAGFATAFVAHETGHLVANFALGNRPAIEGTRVWGFVPFVLIDPQLTCGSTECVKPNGDHFGPGRRGKYFIASAGFHVQQLTDELILSLTPDLRQREAPFRKGMLLFNIGLSAAYVLADWVDLEDPHGDLGTMERMSRRNSALMGLAILLPAALDAYRYFFPSQARWSAWAARASKAGMTGLTFSF